MQYMYWRMHVDVTHSKDEVKEMAAEVRLDFSFYLRATKYLKLNPFVSIVAFIIMIIITP